METFPYLLFHTRTSLYEILAACLSAEPSSEILAALREHLIPLKPALAGADSENLSDAVQRLLDSLNDAGPDALAVDYAGLFLGGAHGAVCPSESSYVDGVLYGQSTRQVIDLYATHGFIKEDTFTEPEDHVALECAFMATLGRDFLETAAESGADGTQDRENLRFQRAFLLAHLGRWIPRWADHVQVCSRTSFYRALADLARALVETDKRLLADLSANES
jgi:putative dimethyl sulfoxide reductase chaperone